MVITRWVQCGHTKVQAYKTDIQKEHKVHHLSLQLLGKKTLNNYFILIFKCAGNKEDIYRWNKPIFLSHNLSIISQKGVSAYYRRIQIRGKCSEADVLITERLGVMCCYECIQRKEKKQCCSSVLKNICLSENCMVESISYVWL